MSDRRWWVIRINNDQEDRGFYGTVQEAEHARTKLVQQLDCTAIKEPIEEDHHAATITKSRFLWSLSKGYYLEDRQLEAIGEL